MQPAIRISATKLPTSQTCKRAQGIRVVGGKASQWTHRESWGQLAQLREFLNKGELQFCVSYRRKVRVDESALERY